MGRFVVLAILIAWSGLAVAEKQPFACQYLASAGLNWEGGRWQTTSFRPNSPFVLVMVGDTLTRDSAAVALATDYLNGVHCRNVASMIACTDLSGGFLYFNPESAMGGVAQMFGATNSASQRDTLSVEPFTCQKF